MTNISGKLEAQLPQELVTLLREIGEIAKSRGERVYLVGGVVRDVILKRPNLDLDLVVEGNAISLARRIAKIKEWKVRTHPHFGTAKLLREGFCLDLVMARSETYEKSGALPTVSPGDIYDDLARRDFTINAMCICLNPGVFGDLLDPHGGQADLEQKLVRILHDQSFVDDPTRILRAIRYEQRLRFQLEMKTNKLLKRDLNNLDTVTGERLWNELELILRKEDFPEKVVLQANALGILQKLLIHLSSQEELEDCFAKARRMDGRSLSLPSVYLAFLGWSMTNEQVEACITRLKTQGWATHVLRDTMRLRDSLPLLEKPDALPSETYHKLKNRIPEVIASAAIVSHSPIAKKRLDLFLNDWRYVKPEITGTDLQSMGAVPGKKIGKILKTLHDAKLNQTVTNRDEEENLARKLI